VAEVSPGRPIADDVVTGRDRHAQVRTSMYHMMYIQAFLGRPETITDQRPRADEQLQKPRYRTTSILCGYGVAAAAAVSVVVRTAKHIER
jgi:hypothetical protein